ncbi:MAG TPA: hypothetical protein VHE12_11070 [bacterium]|nr:hypothetical protein [bacterium]
MNYLKVLLAITLTIGTLFVPAILKGATLTPRSSLDRHFQRQMMLKDKAQAVRKDLEKAKQQIGTTAFGASGRISAENKLAEDEGKLRGYRAALHDGVSYLRAHWDQLSDLQRFEVQEEERSFE